MPKKLIEMIFINFMYSQELYNYYTQPTYTEPPDCSTVQN